MSDDPLERFRGEREQRIAAHAGDVEFQATSAQWLEQAMRRQYMYNFSWLGRPIIQFPVDILAMQELIWRVQPDLIIETGIAHGGSLVFSASMLELLAACGGAPHARVLGVDIDIRAHNRQAIESHPMARRIEMIQGSSTDPAVVAQVRARAEASQRVLVCLDSNHTHDHVLGELRAYAPLVTVGSYCVVFDTIVEEVPAGFFPHRPWGPGNSPKSAMREFLAAHGGFEVDERMNHLLVTTVAPDGFLRRVR